LLYLEKESSKLYFELTRSQFLRYELSWVHYIDRMRFLLNLCNHNDAVYEKASRILLVEEYQIDDDWLNGEGEIINTIAHIKDKDDNNTKIIPGLSKDKNGEFQFLSRKKGLTDWVFHQYDADFHPSIPHGHFQGKKQPKLDAYLGWIYRGSKQEGRLGRSLIIELWNDDEFRIFAYTSIQSYMREFPNFNWRVTDPLKIPRRR
jgi:hypothetical protein